MKTHYRSPYMFTKVLLCGRPLLLYSTKDTRKITCKNCLNMLSILKVGDIVVNVEEDGLDSGFIGTVVKVNYEGYWTVVQYNKTPGNHHLYSPDDIRETFKVIEEIKMSDNTESLAVSKFKAGYIGKLFPVNSIEEAVEFIRAHTSESKDQIYAELGSDGIVGDVNEGYMLLRLTPVKVQTTVTMTIVDVD